jgi:hypothetical protein
LQINELLALSSKILGTPVLNHEIPASAYGWGSTWKNTARQKNPGAHAGDASGSIRNFGHAHFPILTE